MTDRNRNQNQPAGGPQPSSDDVRRQDEQLDDVEGTQSSDRSQRDRASVADDRGADRDRRSFSGDREHDELGSEMESEMDDDVGINETDDDEAGGSSRSDR